MEYLLQARISAKLLVAIDEWREASKEDIPSRSEVARRALWEFIERHKGDFQDAMLVSKLASNGWGTTPRAPARTWGPPMGPAIPAEEDYLPESEEESDDAG
jgi:hypothetical protein